jgi:outer membrane lipoprotein SlyB
MRKILFLLCIFGLSYVSAAQNNPAWSSLTSLHADQKIQIVDTTAKKHSGTFVSVSDNAITYSEATGEHSIQKQDVRSVRLVEHQRRARHTLIGAGIGAGAGAAITAAGWESNGFLGGKGAGAAVGAVIGGISGAVVGALLPTHSTIYNVPSP